MQVGTGKSILNGIAIGKLKIYKKKNTVISAAEVADTAAELQRFEDARAKAIDQQTALLQRQELPPRGRMAAFSALAHGARF